MKQTFKFVTGIFMAIVVISAITLLAVKYFDVLMKVFEDLKSQFSSKRPRFISDACCDCLDDDDLDENESEE